MSDDALRWDITLEHGGRITIGVDDHGGAWILLPDQLLRWITGADASLIAEKMRAAAKYLDKNPIRRPGKP